MDLGATVYLPATPRCAECPLATWCRRAANGGSGPADARASDERSTRPARPPDPPFAATRHWLRGRIVARLRDQPDGVWLVIEGPLGLHDAAAVEAALHAVVDERMIEQRPDGAVRLPSTRR